MEERVRSSQLNPKLLAKCIAAVAHTRKFGTFATTIDTQVLQKGGSTANDEVTQSFLAYLGSYHLPLHRNNSLWMHFDQSKERGWWFVVDHHKGGDRGGNNHTKITCQMCGACVKVEHPNLPPQRNMKAKASLVVPLNGQIRNFLLSKRIQKDLSTRQCEVSFCALGSPPH